MRIVAVAGEWGRGASWAGHAVPGPGGRACISGSQVGRGGGWKAGWPHPDGENDVAANQAARPVVRALKDPALLPREVVGIGGVHRG